MLASWSLGGLLAASGVNADPPPKAIPPLIAYTQQCLQSLLSSHLPPSLRPGASFSRSALPSGPPDSLSPPSHRSCTASRCAASPDPLC